MGIAKPPHARECLHGGALAARWVLTWRLSLSVSEWRLAGVGGLDAR
jgi:hypothetical protein